MNRRESRWLNTVKHIFIFFLLVDGLVILYELQIFLVGILSPPRGWQAFKEYLSKRMGNWEAVSHENHVYMRLIVSNELVYYYFLVFLVSVCLFLVSLWLIRRLEKAIARLKEKGKEGPHY